MKVRVSEATGSVRDWMAAKALGLTVDPLPGLSVWSSVSWEKYSTDWAQGGPIIERENIHTDALPDGGHRAFQRNRTMLQINFMYCWDSTKLETAMRCFVASKLGDEVEVPNELLEAT